MSCLLAMMMPTELTTFIPQAPRSDTAGGFFSGSISPKPGTNPGGGGGGGRRARRGSSRLGPLLLLLPPPGHLLLGASRGRGRWVIKERRSACRLGTEGKGSAGEGFELFAAAVARTSTGRAEEEPGEIFCDLREG